jgi:phosphoribosylaminoimidazole carboxylase PurE protein
MSKIALIIGSDSDLETIRPCLSQLDDFGISYELRVLSAHRTPNELKKYVNAAEKKGVKIIIAGAGLAAHLPGVIASYTALPVIGVPLSGLAEGMDALLSIVQMPGGIPVATMAVGKPGAKNAALFAAQVLAVSDPGLRKKMREFRKKMKTELALKEKKVRELLKR